ncbi:hypothetical protein [Dyadobacter arcticus]|uniref:Uncharacterized protein n=1 Tax=Dyadobacter arcticus TaxID=1078754 RepID=A0ABX0ULY1_9BACT|nr:hypothetical protein [Dyadobacter arcticus]NIJ54018.1 hypothetical protein [Dyadobacter arcticus]
MKQKKVETRLLIANELMGCAKDGPLSNMTDEEIKYERYKDFMKKNGWLFEPYFEQGQSHE